MRLNTKSRRLFLIFFGYLLSIVIYSIIYYNLYLTNNNHFSFNAEIFAQQHATVLSDQERNLRAIMEGREIVVRLLKAAKSTEIRLFIEPQKILGLLTGVQIRDEANVIYLSDFCGGVAHMAGCAHWRRRILISDNTKTQIGDYNFPLAKFRQLPESMEEVKQALMVTASLLGERISTHQQRISQLASRQPAVWTYLDFLYFSVITQSTVGYGDMLPNSTEVRAVVSSQILIGIVILVVVLSIVVAGRSGDHRFPGGG